MLDVLLNPEVSIVLAGGAYVLGYLITDQVALRLMLLLGTALYIVYYFTAASDPLWGGIYASVLMGTANLIGIGLLCLRRSTLSIPAQFRDLYPQFSHLPPGDFRTLMRLARRYRTEREEVITKEGAPVERLVYIVDGQAEVTKGGERFRLPPGIFVGEVAYLLRKRSVATNVLPAGSQLLEWATPDLDRACKRNPRFRVVLEAALAKDMAAKVSMAVAPSHMRTGATFKEAVSFETVRSG